MKQIRKNITMPFGKKDQTNKVGLGLSITILALVVLAYVAVFCDTHTYGNMLDMSGKPIMDNPVYSSLDAHLLGYLSFVSALLAAILAIINIVEFSLVKTKKLERLHKWLHIVNLAMVSQQAFNFVFTIVYLIPMCCLTKVYNFEYLFTGSNLIFNVAIPVLVVFMYVFCFKSHSTRNIWWSLLGMIPTFLYFTIYMTLALSHTTNGIADKEYDFYLFGSVNKYYIILAFISIMIAAAGVSIGVDQLNKVGKLNRYMTIAVVNIFLAAVIVAFSGVMFNTNVNGDRYVENLGAAQTFFMRFMYFTHLSNWWVGATSVIYAVYCIKIFQGKSKQIPIWAQTMRLAGIAAISITLIMQFVVAAGWMLDSTSTWAERLTEGYIKCFRKHLLFEHFITPFLAMASFIVLEHTQLKWKHILHAASPLAIYILCYAIVLYATINMPLRKTPEHPKWVSPYDIYEIREVFGSVGKYIYWALPPLVYIVMLGLNWVFWYFNRKIHFDHPKKGPALAELKQDWAKYKQSRK